MPKTEDLIKEFAKKYKKPFTVKDIENIHIKTGTARRALNILVEKGELKRKYNIYDCRMKIYTLSH